MRLGHSTVPLWPEELPPLDWSGTALAVVSYGDAGAEAARGWLRAAASGLPAWWLRDPTTAELRDELAACRVGIRLAVAGPETAVLAAAATARAAGLLDAELTLHATSALRRKVFCAHCKGTTEAAVAVGATATCSGCGRGLAVYAHLSARSGSYLGFQADAEELV